MKGIESMIKAMNYILSHLQMKNRPIYINGHGRSGTSWIGTTFQQAPGILYYGEPCNPKVVKGGDFSHWFRYVRPDGSDSYFESCLDHSFNGLDTFSISFFKLTLIEGCTSILLNYNFILKTNPIPYYRKAS